MPRMDGTGPAGHGSGTGRRFGKCKSAEQPQENNVLGKGLGKRRRSGGGDGLGKRFQADPRA